MNLYPDFSDGPLPEPARITALRQSLLDEFAALPEAERDEIRERLTNSRRTARRSTTTGTAGGVEQVVYAARLKNGRFYHSACTHPRTRDARAECRRRYARTMGD